MMNIRCHHPAALGHMGTDGLSAPTTRHLVIQGPHVDNALPSPCDYPALLFLHKNLPSHHAGAHAMPQGHPVALYAGHRACASSQASKASSAHAKQGTTGRGTSQRPPGAPLPCCQNNRVQLHMRACSTQRPGNDGIAAHDQQRQGVHVSRSKKSKPKGSRCIAQDQGAPVLWNSCCVC